MSDGFINGGLLLTRKPGESCVCNLGDMRLLVIVDEIANTKVKLRFVGDKSIEILRTELTGDAQ